MRILLVGESAPAGGTHYYRANSNLFTAVRDAVVRVYGASIPQGREFLDFAQSQGLWLVDLASEPVNHLARAERRRAVRAGIPRVARVIRASQPAVVVAMKTSIDGDVLEALAASGVNAKFVALPFPLMQWRPVFVSGLASVLRQDRRRRRTG